MVPVTDSPDRLPAESRRQLRRRRFHPADVWFIAALHFNKQHRRPSVDEESRQYFVQLERGVYPNATLITGSRRHLFYRHTIRNRALVSGRAVGGVSEDDVAEVHRI